MCVPFILINFLIYQKKNDAAVSDNLSEEASNLIEDINSEPKSLYYEGAAFVCLAG